jgi:DNA-binding GntR family transcriptional regulator
LQEFYTTKKDAENIKDMDSKFHEIVYNNCGSRVLSDILNQLHRKLIKYRKASVSNNERAFQSVKEHREILEAILKGDGNLAEKLTVEHIKNAKVNIEKEVKE